MNLGGIPKFAKNQRRAAFDTSENQVHSIYEQLAMCTIKFFVPSINKEKPAVTEF